MASLIAVAWACVMVPAVTRELNGALPDPLCIPAADALPAVPAIPTKARAMVPAAIAARVVKVLVLIMMSPRLVSSRLALGSIGQPSGAFI
ncbi:unannotated protein [freshwater metagenome]|uniref:Unannotated protein n=1 Tax=freshwater metagenome TaxID=449393 RepID=A0A6J6T475_9ZZZZ